MSGRSQGPTHEAFPLLPSGVRDHLPDATARLFAVQRVLRDTFAGWGYSAVITPLYEYVAVLERGLGRLRRRETFKFVEPRTGEVVALRPDITPQVARLYATRFRGSALPQRFCYDGRVVRYAQEASASAEGDVGMTDAGARGPVARRDWAPREVFQAGVELLDAGGTDADVEVVALLVCALEAAGLAGVHVDLGHGEVARAIFDDALRDRSHRSAVAACVARKDAAGLAEVCDAAAISGERRAALEGLLRWFGGPAVLDEASRTVSIPAARAALDELRDVVRRLDDEGLGARITVDLGELRDLDYHDGVLFHAYAHGVPHAVAGGGRYDRLLERYGRAARATGFAIDIEALLEAQERQASGALGTKRPRVLVLSRGRGGRDLANALRTRGCAAVRALAAEETRDTGGAFDACARQDGDAVRLTRADGFEWSGTSQDLAALDCALLLRVPAAEVK